MSDASLISIMNYDGKRFTVPAVVISPRIAVHRRTRLDGRVEDWWHVSDPVSGFAWLTHFNNEAAALKWARSLRRKFGPNPLKGAIVNPKGGWKRKGVYHAKVEAHMKEAPAW